MSEQQFQRGVVKSITFEIEYPDGSSKTVKLPETENLALIAFDKSAIPATDGDLFDVSADDWSQNPAMLLYEKKTVWKPRPRPYCTSIICELS